ncbi:MAG: type III ribulose-bisphosphate carboxylase [Candidatus Bathyarchaeota archaeon]|nr:MAG: type III ribulose-bisphosphate carboxylase [Candidatus Bathyarchaeota archaeon]
MRYIDFVHLGYDPSEEDLICEFHVKPLGITIEEAAGGVAAESSIGTWTELTTEKPYVRELQARVFSIEGNEIKVAYPIGLFEAGNMPNVLSSVAGNVFGLEDIRRLRLEDIHLPSKLVDSFPGPKHGVEGVRRLLMVKGRPLVGTIIKPKLGLRTPDHAEVAHQAWVGGCDVVKDDENLSGQGFNSFEERVVQTLERRDLAEEETGERKAYMVNVTAETEEMVERAEFVEAQGGRYMMVDIITCGFSALQTLRKKGLDLVIHAHRAGHAAFTRLPDHGISMRVVAKLARILGVDQLHVGAVVGKMSETREEVEANIDALVGRMHGLKRVLPVASGGLHPGLVPELIEIFGSDFAMQAGGGIHGHPSGTEAGAKAMRQAVEAVLEGVGLEDYAEDHRELSQALRTWSAT